MNRFSSVLIVSCLILLQAKSESETDYTSLLSILPPGEKVHLVKATEDKVNLGRGLAWAAEYLTESNFGLHFNIVWEFALGFDFPIWSDLH
jgi:hypothetical protein